MYQLTVFKQGCESDIARRAALRRVIAFLLEENPRAKYIFFREESKSKSLCGNILIAGQPDIIGLYKKTGCQVAMVELPPQSFPLILDYIDNKAGGKYVTGRGTTMFTMFLRCQGTSILRFCREELQKERVEEKMSFLKDLLLYRA